MQDIPLIATQSAPMQGQALKTGGQYTNDNGISFKDMLSKQAVNDSPKKPEKAITPKQTQVTSQAQKPKANEAKQKESREDLEQEAAKDVSANSPSDPLPEGLEAAKRNEVAAEEVEAALVSQDAMNLPGAPVLVIANTPIVLKNEIAGDTQKQEEVDTNTKVALTTNGANGKTIATEETEGNSVKNKARDGLPADSETKAELDNKWLESMLPKMREQAQSGAASAAEKLPLEKLGVDKLTTDKATQSLQEITAKSRNELTTVVTSAAQQAVSLMDAAQLKAASSNTIQVPVGKTGWDQAISQKVVWMVGADVQSATLTLNPPDLGPLQVVISVNNDKADTTFISENPEVRKVLENGISTLRGLMDQAGVQLGEANVSTGKQQQEFQQAARERTQQFAAKSSSAQAIEQPVNSRITLRSNSGLVDTFA